MDFADSSFTIHELKDEYIHIRTRAKLYYGGVKNWFYTADQNSREVSLIQNEGCGAAAAGDLLLYLAEYLPDCRKLIQNIDFSNGSISYEEYYDFICDLEKNYIRPIDLYQIIEEEYDKVRKDHDFGRVLYHLGYSLSESIISAVTEKTGTIGVWPTGFANGIERYCREHGLQNIVCKTLYFPTNRTKEKLIASLRENIPVPIMIGVGGAKDISFFKMPDGDPCHTQIKSTEKVNAHWAVVTKYIEDPVNGDRMMVSSWGEQYYIRFQDFVDHAGLLGCVVQISTGGGYSI